jgi:carboxymethylenebutenolidase
MIEPEVRQRAIALYDAFTHTHHDRRAFLRDLTVLAGSAAAAQTLLVSIGANPVAAAIVPAGDPRVTAQDVTWAGAEGRIVKGYMVRPAGAAKKRAAVIVVHENRGLNDHIRDVARRVALAGYLAVAPDFLSSIGGTPPDENVAREAIGKLDLAATVADAVATARWLGGKTQSTGQVGAVGFCWGGALVNRLAVAAGAALKGGVAYYGPAPDPARAADVKAAMLLHYAGLDDRVNTGAPAWVAALKSAKVDVTAYTYDGVNHAFNNDTAVGRYDKAAADLAWSRTLAFFKGTLK